MFIVTGCSIKPVSCRVSFDYKTKVFLEYSWADGTGEDSLGLRIEPADVVSAPEMISGS